MSDTLVFPPNPVADETFGGWIWVGDRWAPNLLGVNPQSGMGNIGRNLVDNAMFNILQRGTGPWTVPLSYTADRWQMFFQGGSATTIWEPAVDTVRSQVGDESLIGALVCTFVGGTDAAAEDGTQILQPIEGVQRLSGKRVIVSFYAASVPEPLRLGVGFIQIFGAGGSEPVVVPFQGVNLTTNWGPRYSLTFDIPSSIGKVIGTDATDHTAFYFSLSHSTIEPGIQSGTIGIWGVQVEIAQAGQVEASPLEKLDPEADFMRCQRFFFNVTAGLGGYSPEGLMVPAGNNRAMAVVMRAAPTVTLQTFGLINVLQVIVAGSDPFSVATGVALISPGQFLWNGVMQCSADL